MKRHLTIVAICLAQAGLALAQEPAHAPEHDRGFHHRHHVSMVIGASVESPKKGITVGGDYELRLHRYVGVSVSGEWVGGDLNEMVWAFPVLFHPTKNWKFMAGPGFLHEFGHKEEGHSDSHSRSAATVESGGHGSFLFRVEAGYDFHVKRLSITPIVAVDFVAPPPYDFLGH